MHKDWEKGIFFFQMPKSQQKITKHTKKQGNMYDQSICPEMDPKQIEIYELSDK